MQHAILVADSVNSCAALTALEACLRQEQEERGANHKVPAEVEDGPCPVPSPRHSRFHLFTSKQFTLLYVKDLSAAGAGLYLKELQSYARTFLNKQVSELTARHPNIAISVIGMTERISSDNAKLIVLGPRPPTAEVTVTGVCAAIYEWCQFVRSKPPFPQDLRCTILLLERPGAQIYPYVAYSRLYLSAAPLANIGLPPQRLVTRDLERLIQTYMNSISLVYI